VRTSEAKTLVGSMAAGLMEKLEAQYSGRVHRNG
jgi:hypothetical protein